MQVNRILETCLYVDDLVAAKAFYADVLGLQFHSEVAGRHVFFRCGDAMLLLFNPAATAISTSEIPTHGAIGQGHVAFMLAESEIEHWRDHLVAQHVPIELEYTWGNGGFSVYFRDPAGNSLELTTPRTWGLEEQRT